MRTLTHKLFAKRFWSKVRVAESGCWEWTAKRSGPMRYGGFSTGGARVVAHRVVWELIHGSIPEGLFVLHKCDNPPCCNPQHLFIGSQADNIRDMDAKGRRRCGKGPRGATHHSARLTEADVLRIRSLAQTVSQSELARQYGMSQGTIGPIVRGETWKHLLEPEAQCR